MGATYCVECGNWQNWRRFTNVSSVVLSLFVALVSVATFLLAEIRRPQPQTSIDLAGTLEHRLLPDCQHEGCNEYYFDLSFYNTGSTKIQLDKSLYRISGARNEPISEEPEAIVAWYMTTTLSTLDTAGSYLSPRLQFAQGREDPNDPETRSERVGADFQLCVIDIVAPAHYFVVFQSIMDIVSLRGIREEPDSRENWDYIERLEQARRELRGD